MIVTVKDKIQRTISLSPDGFRDGEGRGEAA